MALLATVAGLWAAPGAVATSHAQEAAPEGGDEASADLYERDEDRVWSVRLGIAGGTEPAYPGSDEYNGKPFPIVDIRWGQLIFINDREGAGFNLAHGRHLRAGVALTYDEGRDADVSRRLKGLGDISATIEFGGLLVFSAYGARIDGQFRQDIFGGHEGWLVDFGAGYRTAIGGSVEIDLHIGSTWASEDYMQAYFGVDGLQSAASGLPAFDVASGFRDVAFRTRMTIGLDAGWFAAADFRAARLLGEASDSPITVEENQYRGWLGFGYSF